MRVSVDSVDSSPCIQGPKGTYISAKETCIFAKKDPHIFKRDLDIRKRDLYVYLWTLWIAAPAYRGKKEATYPQKRLEYSQKRPI